MSIEGGLKVNGRVSVRVQAVWCSPGMARELLGFNTFERQRPYRAWYAHFLANEIEAGRFLPLERIVFVVCPGQDPVLVDGQHRLNAIAMAGEAQLVELIYFEGLNRQEMAQYYARIDGGITRTKPDRIRALGLKEELGLNESKTRVAAGAMGVILAGMKGSGRGRQSPEDIAAGVLDYQEGYRLWLESISGAPEEMRLPFIRASAVAAGIVTCQDAPGRIGEEKAAEFWRGVALDDGLRTGDPRKTLRTDMLVTTRQHANGGRLISIDESLWRIARCWNGWLAGDRIVALAHTVRSKRGFIALQQTRFDGGAHDPRKSELEVEGKQSGGRKVVG